MSIEIDNSAENLPDLTVNALRKNMEEVGVLLEGELDQFESILFEIAAAYAPSQLDLATPSIRICVYTFDKWIQVMLAKARPVTITEVRSWWLKAEPRFGDGCRLRTKSRAAVVEAEVSKPKLELSLEDLDL